MSKELGELKEIVKKELAEIRAEIDELLPEMNKLNDRYSLLMKRKGFLDSSQMNLESYLIEKGDADAN